MLFTRKLQQNRTASKSAFWWKFKFILPKKWKRAGHFLQKYDFFSTQKLNEIGEVKQERIIGGFSGIAKFTFTLGLNILKNEANVNIMIMSAQKKCTGFRIKVTRYSTNQN